MINITIQLSNENADLAAVGLPADEGQSVTSILETYVLKELSERAAAQKATAIMSPHQDEIEATKNSVKQNQGNNP